MSEKDFILKYPIKYKPVTLKYYLNIVNTTYN